MALSDIQVYSQYAYGTATELLAQQVDLFNAATNNALVLTSAKNSGDFNYKTLFAKISGGTVKRRNAYGTGAQTPKKMTNLQEISVKVASGVPTMEMNPGQWAWIQQDPKIAGAAFGQQLAKDMLADMLNTSIGIAYAAIVQTTGAVADLRATSGLSNATGVLDVIKLVQGKALFGDAADNLNCWIMHSKPIFDVYGQALANTQRLFKYGDVVVTADIFGSPLIITDSPALVTTGSPNVYHTLGLAAGAVVVEQNGDFDDNYDERNGDENILRTYQAEWTNNYSLKGYAWNTGSGGHSPTDSALLSSSNWVKYSTSLKDTAGVVIQTL